MKGHRDKTILQHVILVILRCMPATCGFKLNSGELPGLVADSCILEHIDSNVDGNRTVNVRIQKLLRKERGIKNGDHGGFSQVSSVMSVVIGTIQIKFFLLVKLKKKI